MTNACVASAPSKPVLHAKEPTRDDFVCGSLYVSNKKAFVNCIGIFVIQISIDGFCPSR